MFLQQLSTVPYFLKFIFPNNILGNEYLCVRFNSKATSSENLEAVETLPLPTGGPPAIMRKLNLTFPVLVKV